MHAQRDKTIAQQYQSKAARAHAKKRQDFSPDSVGHVDVLALLAVDAAHEGEVRLEALLREEPVDEGVEQALVEVVVDPPSVDALGEQGTESAPRDLVGRKVGATLGERKSE